MAQVGNKKTHPRHVEDAEVVATYGPFPGTHKVNGVTCGDGEVWFATGEALKAFEPSSGAIVSSLDVPCDAGTAFDGRYLYQLHDDHILKVDPVTGAVLSTLRAPAGGTGLTWAEGTLWMGRYEDRTIDQIDPATGAVLRTVQSDRFVTGVTWTEGELWHGTMEDGRSEIRHVDPDTGHVLTELRMPEGTHVSGLEADRGGLFYAGCPTSGAVRAVRRPRRRR